MVRTVLHDKSGKDISWLDATVQALKIIGHPATVEEIYEVMGCSCNIKNSDTNHLRADIYTFT